jgi:cephalosporin hydroxylase
MTLWSEFLTHQGTGVSKWKQYFPAYQRHLSKFIDQSVLLVEIGVSGGGSLRLWKKFLGPFVRIVGIDTDVLCKQLEEDQISVRLGDQSDSKFLQSIVDEFGHPDIVIDDGSHRSEDQINALQLFYPLLTKNGVYVIEDLHVAYWDKQAGVVPDGKNTIDLCKSLIDDLHGRYVKDRRSKFTDTTRSISFYDSMVVFERGIVQNLYAPVIGTGDGNPGIVIDSKGLRVLDAGESVPQDT